MKNRTWNYWIPEDGYDEDDATEITVPSFYDAYLTASHICQQDYSDSAGERGLDHTFIIMLRDDTGRVTQWKAYNEIDVSHHVDEVPVSE